MQKASTTHVRSLFISDLHLGTRACRIEELSTFLSTWNADLIYLVGDIVDLWRFRKSGFYFPQKHVNVIRKLLGKTKHGTRILYIPGNHDDLIRQFIDVNMEPAFGRIQVLHNAVHTCLDGRKLLVIHGDQSDLYVKILDNKVLHWLIDRVYTLLMILSLATRPVFKEGRTLSQRVRRRIKSVSRYYRNFQVELTGLARKGGFDGVICGHIHHPELARDGGLVYGNCGDWVDHCTAIVEHHDGRMELVRATGNIA
jgi:UDP-2,3-diacylglucosamine pyrophosphatase LpxH